MKKILLTFCCIISQLISAQITSEEIRSTKLGESRKITIIAPEQYDKNQKYPLFIVLNANRLLEPVVSSMRYFVRSGEVPPAIIVGIYNEEHEVIVPEETGVPFNDSANFFEFVGQEVIPHVQKKYSTNNFKGIIADGDAGNFINYYLLKENSLFNAYFSLNPTLLPNIIDPLATQLGTFKKPIFYYLAWTENEDNSKVDKINNLHRVLNTIQLENVMYFAGNFPKVSPIAVAPGGIPEALNLTFSEYRPISMREYAEKVVKINENVVGYLQDKYQDIKDLYDIDKKPLIEDIKAIYAAILKNGDLESLPILANFVRPYYKETALADFFEADYYDRLGDTKRAIRSYQRAFALSSIDFVTKEMLGQKLEVLQKNSRKKGKKGAEPVQETPVEEQSISTEQEIPME